MITSNRPEVDHLHFHLASYLSGLPAPSDDVFTDPAIALQEYVYQETIREFCGNIGRELEYGNGRERSVEVMINTSLQHFLRSSV